MANEGKTVYLEDDAKVIATRPGANAAFIYFKPGRLQDAVTAALDIAEQPGISVYLAPRAWDRGGESTLPKDFIKIGAAEDTTAADIVRGVMNAREFTHEEWAENVGFIHQLDDETGVMQLFFRHTALTEEIANTALAFMQEFHRLRAEQDAAPLIVVMAAGRAGDGNKPGFTATGFMHVNPATSVTDILHDRMHARGEENCLEAVGEEPGNVLRMRLRPAVKEVDALSAAVSAWCVHEKSKNRPTVKFEFNGCVVTVDDRDPPRDAVSCIPPDRRIYRAPGRQGA